MLRPPSIVRYEQFYLSSFVLGTVASALNWKARVAMLAASPMLAGQTWLLWASSIIGIAISLTLWYFTARRPSVVAKWIVVVLAAFGACTILLALYAIYRLTEEHWKIGTAMIVMLIANALYIAAAAMLFRHDAASWFGDIPAGEELFA